MKIICISGKAQHGKDTTARFMRTELEKSCKVLVVHYADLLRYICEKFFDWDGFKNKEGRTLLQYVGTNVVRRTRPDFWVEFVASILLMFNNHWDYVLIPDCRFPNEIEYLRNAGFDVTHIRVVRDGFKSPLTEEQQAHLSETALDEYPIDVLLHNDGTLPQFRDSVTAYVNEMFYGHQLSIEEVLSCES